MSAQRFLSVLTKLFFTLTCTEKPLKFYSNKFFSIYNYLFRFFCLFGFQWTFTETPTALLFKVSLKLKQITEHGLCLAGTLSASKSTPRLFSLASVSLLLEVLARRKHEVAFLYNLAFCLLLTSLVGPSGLEPPTSCLSGTRSNLLSYEPMWLVSDFGHLVGGDDGIRSRRELRALVAVGRKRPPEVCSVPPLFESCRNWSPDRFRWKLQSPIWWRWWDSNPWPPACRAGALPAELHPHIVGLLSPFFQRARGRTCVQPLFSVSALNYLPVQSPVKYCRHCRA